MARLPQSCSSMQSRGLFLGCSVTNIPPPMIVLAWACLKRRNTRGRQNFADGKFRTSCFREITRGLWPGEKNKDSKERSKTGRICFNKFGRDFWRVAPKPARERRALPYLSQHHARVNSAKSKRVAHDVSQFRFASVIWNNIEIASRIGILVVNCRGNPLSIQRQGAKRRFDRTGRAERMRVITFCAADWNSLGVIAEHLFDRHRFGPVI